MRTIHRAIIGISILVLAACSGGVAPKDVFLTLSVSTGDIAVVTGINGKANSFLSGESGSMTASGPINDGLNEGENEISFTLAPAEDTGDEFEPRFLAALEITLKGEVVDTLSPGDRVIFNRELTDSEIASLLAGKEVIISERFTLSRAELEKMAAAAR